MITLCPLKKVHLFNFFSKITYRLTLQAAVISYTHFQYLTQKLAFTLPNNCKLNNTVWDTAHTVPVTFSKAEVYFWIYLHQMEE